MDANDFLLKTPGGFEALLRQAEWMGKGLAKTASVAAPVPPATVTATPVTPGGRSGENATIPRDSASLPVSNGETCETSRPGAKTENPPYVPESGPAA
jgi:hypothetical protein